MPWNSRSLHADVRAGTDCGQWWTWRTLGGNGHCAQRVGRGPWVLNCPNGSLDLRTGALRPHDPADHLTRLCGAEYRLGYRHEVLDRFLREMLGDSDLRTYVQRLCGYALCGDRREQVFAFVYGPTASGKTTFTEGMKTILRDYSAVVNESVFSEHGAESGGATPELAALADARMVFTTEVSEKRMDNARLKKLTGSETISCRALYAKPFEYRPEFLLTFVGNHRPKVNGDDQHSGAGVASFPLIIACLPHRGTRRLLSGSRRILTFWRRYSLGPLRGAWRGRRWDCASPRWSAWPPLSIWSLRTTWPTTSPRLAFSDRGLFCPRMT